MIWQCAVTPTNGTSKILSGDFRVGTLTSPGVSQPVAIEMFTATGAVRDNAPWGDIQKVTYELRDPTDRNEPGKDLYRSVTRNIMATRVPRRGGPMDAGRRAKHRIFLFRRLAMV